MVIAAITRCTNTSNPSVLLAAGLLAKKAVEKGLKLQAVGQDQPGAGQPGGHRLSRRGRPADTYLDKLGFNLVGYGCTTCIGNSGPLPEPISDAVEEGDLVVAAVLSGNRNFEGRVHPQMRANYLASPPLVVAYALAGNDPARSDHRAARQGRRRAAGVPERHLADRTRRSPTRSQAFVDPEMFRQRYGNVFAGAAGMAAIQAATGQTYSWEDSSTYVELPPCSRT